MVIFNNWIFRGTAVSVLFNFFVDFCTRARLQSFNGTIWYIFLTVPVRACRNVIDIGGIVVDCKACVCVCVCVCVCCVDDIMMVVMLCFLMMYGYNG